MLKSASTLTILGLVAFANVASAATPASDTVPTSQLIAQFTVQNVPGSSTVALNVELAQVVVSNGQAAVTQLTQSADDVVTFTTSAGSLTYDPVNVQNDTMAAAPNGAYEATFKRFNGETYTANVTMPAAATFSSPASGAVFKKSDAVTISWSPPASSDMGLFVLTTEVCTSNTGSPSFNDSYTSAQIPAGFVSGCSGAVNMQFDAIYSKYGTGFGSFAAISDASLPFSYGARSESSDAGQIDFDYLHRVERAVRNHEKTLVITR